MNLNKLRKEIEHQSRNGRDNMYIEVSDIQELIYGVAKNIQGKERVYISINTLNEMINRYEKINNSPKNKFKENLKVNSPDYKLEKIDERGFLFQPIKEDEREL